MATALKLRSDIKKLKKAIDTKGISAAIKVKLRNQLEKAENELASMQKGGKPRKVSTTKGTATTLTALQKLIKRKKYGVYQGKGVDLKKDAGEGAKATGRRVSKGLKANQFGSKGQNKGNVYYEYRPNRIDVKQPSKKAKYPKLEKGGELEEQTVYLQVKPRFYDELKEKADKDNIHLEFIEDNEDGYEVYRAEMTKNQLSDFKKEIPFTYSFDYKYAKGGMTATKANVIFKQYERNEGRNDHSENVVLLAKHFGTKEDLQLAQSIQKKHDSLGHMPPDLMKQRDELSDKLYPMLVAAKKKVDGVMAKGGQVSGKFRFVPYKSQGDMLVSTKLEGVSPDNVMVKGLEGKLKGDDFNSAEYVANIILEEHPNIDMVQIIKVGASVLKNKKVAAIKRDSDNSSSFKVEYFEEGGVMAKGGKTIGHTMYFVPQKNLGGKSIQSDSDIRGNYKHMDAVLDKKLGNNYLGSTFYINDGYGKIALEDDKKVAQIKSILEMFDFEDATSKYSKEKGGYNTGASWSMDRARHNKSEDYEIPINKRKLEDGGVISKTHKIG